MTDLLKYILKTAISVSQENEHGYHDFERIIAQRVAVAKGPLFTTDRADVLFDTYLSGIPAEWRQHYVCHCCRRFITAYGGLVMLDARGMSIPALWNPADVPSFFAPTTQLLFAHVVRSRVNGVFVSDAKIWGTPRTGDWTHLAGAPAQRYTGVALTPFQKAAEHAEEYKMLSRAVSEIPLPLAEEALRVVASDTLDRSEKATGIAQWFVDVHRALKDAKGPTRNNLLWRFVAMAPPGFCHVSNTMIGTVYVDLVAGKGFEDIKRAWNSKMHPLQYQRPTAPPSDGAIKQAEKLFETLGLGPSLDRRYARLDEVTAFWRPAPDEPTKPSGEGLFGHLKQRPTNPTVTLPPRTMTWAKFERDILSTARRLECLAPGHGGYFGLTTAVHSDAPAILQWDGLEGFPRNPVAWYFYHGGSQAQAWGLTSGHYVPVNAVMLKPPHWQKPDIFTHQGRDVLFVLEGANDKRGPGNAIFPETLRAELHGVRSVIEAYSQRAKIANPELGTANGLALNGASVQLRVNGADVFVIDRME